MNKAHQSEAGLKVLGERFKRMRGDIGRVPVASVVIPVNVQGDLEKVLPILGDLSAYTGDQAVEIVLLLNNYDPHEEPRGADVYCIDGIRIVSIPDTRQPGFEAPIAARMRGIEVAAADLVILFDADCRIPNATALIDWYVKQFQAGADLAYTHVGYYELDKHWSVWLRIRLHHLARWIKRVPLQIPTARGSNYAANRKMILMLYREGYLAADLSVGTAFRAQGARIVYSGARDLAVLTSGRMFSPQGVRRLYRYFRYRLRYNLRVLPVRRDAHRHTGRDNEPVRRYVNGKPVIQGRLENDNPVEQRSKTRGR